MDLSRETVEQIAHLARLELTEEQKRTYQQQLSAILDAVASLSELDLDGVEPTTHAIPTHNRLRTDQAAAPLAPAAVLANAPRHAQQQFVIQAVLDE